MATIYYAFPNGIGVPVVPFRNMPDYDVLTSGHVLNATGNIAVLIGRINLEGGFAGGSKTISAAGGGSLYFRPVSSAGQFVNGGTLLRVGLQDITSGGDQDGTFDVSADLIGGVDTIGDSGSITHTIMETGSKTLTHGDYVAVVFEMVTRGGTDQVNIHGMSSSSQMTPDQIPYSIHNGVRDRVVPYCCIKFDDGTVGWFSNNVFGVISGTSFNVNSIAQDEIGSVFKLPFSCKVQHLYASMICSNTPAVFEVVLYSSPLSSSPVVMTTVTVEAAKLYNATTRGVDILLDSLVQLEQNVYYAITIRPTNGSSVSLESVSFGNDVALKAQTMLGADWSHISRLNNSGPFTVDPLRVAHVGLYATEIGLVGDTAVYFT